MPFFGWIQDLSEKTNSLFNLFGLLPYDVPSFSDRAWPVAVGVQCGYNRN